LYDPFPAKFETERSDWAPTYQGAKRQNFKPIASAVMDRSLRSDVIGGKSACPDLTPCDYFLWGPLKDNPERYGCPAQKNRRRIITIARPQANRSKSCPWQMNFMDTSSITKPF